MSGPYSDSKAIKSFIKQINRQNKTPGCWIWKGPKNSDGYGIFVNKAAGRNQLAHRVSWTLRNGPIPAGLEVRHFCKGYGGKPNRACVNPSHLKLGTHFENMQDAKRHGSFNRTGDIKAKDWRYGKRPGRTPRVFSPGEMKAINEMKRRGKPWKAIGRAVGASDWIVKRAWKEWNGDDGDFNTNLHRFM